MAYSGGELLSSLSVDEDSARSDMTDDLRSSADSGARIRKWLEVEIPSVGIGVRFEGG